MTTTRTAVVTGASSGIGAATARALAAEGFRVVCAARREDRVSALAGEIDGVAVRCDVTSPVDVAALADVVGPRLDVLVNNAGAAFGADPVASADADDWRRMYEVNVIGLLQVTQALLPALLAADAGVIVNVGSTAGRIAYEGGAGYAAAKHGTQVVTETLRLELYDQPVRVCEIAPGMVRTDEFTANRFAGDQAKVEAVYAGVAEPLLAEDVADAITWVATRPPHVNVDEMVIRPRAQAAQHKVHRILPPSSAVDRPDAGVGDTGLGEAIGHVEVTRTGGLAGFRRAGEARLGDDPRTAEIERLLGRIDLDAVPPSPPEADRYVYTFTVDGQAVTVGEQDLTADLAELALLVLGE